MYQKQIEQLVILQKLDQEMQILRQDLEDAPKEVAEMEARLGEMRQARDQVAEKIQLFSEQLSRLGQEVEDDSLRIKKSKNKLMLATNTREYHAMMREMDNLEKLNRLREDENMTLREELTRQEENLAQQNEGIAAMEATIAAKRASLDERLAESRKRYDALEAERGQSSTAVPPPILKRYEFIRSRLPAPVIVHVDNGICSGCHISIPPQTYNELQRGRQIHSCPNCQRLIYWAAHLRQPEEAEA